MVNSMIELKCRFDDDTTVFVVRNLSNICISQMELESFDLIAFGNSRTNLLFCNNSFPTSLMPYEETTFTNSHISFRERKIGYVSFELVFVFEDAESNRFRCVARKNAEDGRKQIYMQGNWEVSIVGVSGNNNIIVKNERPTVFISYNWGSENTANELEKNISSLATVERDKSSIRPWGSINDFMRKIRVCDFVVVILSKSYLESIACLKEIMLLVKDDNWITHSMFLVEDDAKDIYTPCGKVKYIKHWKDMGEKLEKEIEGLNPALITTQAEELKTIKLIQLHINDFMTSVADRNNPDILTSIGLIEQRIKKHPEESKTQLVDSKEDIIEHPIFDVKIIGTNCQIPGTAEVLDLWGKSTTRRSNHKNVQIQVELCNDIIVRNMKILDRNVEDAVSRKNKKYYITVCYQESPDTRWHRLVTVLTRDRYPAHEDGIPQSVTIEYLLKDDIYVQVYRLDNDQKYIYEKTEKIQLRNLDKAIQMKNSMYKDFIKPASELRLYTSEQLFRYPHKKLISDEVIIMSINCKDPKWNTDGGFGRYEVFDLCDDGLLLWDPNSPTLEVKYYHGEELCIAETNRLLCLLYEDICNYDLAGNAGYRMPIIYSDNQLGETWCKKYYYRDRTSNTLIDNALIVDIRPSD